MCLKVVHVVPHIDKEASGPSYSVPRLCQSLAACRNEVELACLAAKGEIPGVSVTVYRQWPVAKRFAVSPSCARALWERAGAVDIVHNHSLWSMVNVASGWVVPGRRAKFVVSPRGTLSRWALSRSRHLKRVLWPLQRRALTSADMLHATSMAEYRDIRSLGFEAPVCIIPNGIDIPPGVPSRRERSRPDGHRKLLFLGRIHPTKGIDRLLRAWEELEHRHPDWRLIVAGQGSPDYEREIRQLARSLGLRRVDFVGPLYGSEKSQAYVSADLFVLPSHSENFGVAVAEALAHACPVVVGQGAPWERVIEERCGWWVSNEVDALCSALDAAMSLSDVDRSEMGARGRRWMEREFDWKAIGKQMTAAYQWLVNGGPVPECLRID